MANNPPFQTIQTFAALPGNIPSLTFANPFPGTPTIPANATINAVASNRTNGYMQQWNFTLEGEVAKNTALRASYVGNKGTHLDRQDNLNDPGPGPVWSNCAVRISRSEPSTIMNRARTPSSVRCRSVWSGALQRVSPSRSEYQFNKSLTEQPFGIAAPTNPFYARLIGATPIPSAPTTSSSISPTIYPSARDADFSLSGVEDGVLGGWQIAGISSLEPDSRFL